MPEKLKSLHPNTRHVWCLIAAVGVFDIACLATGKLSVAPSILLSNLAVIALMAGLSYVYANIRRDARIAALAHQGAATLGFSAVSAILSYVTAAWGLPLVDSSLAAADHALGLDWLAAYNWVIEHKRIHALFLLAYWSLAGQMILLLITLNFLGFIRRGWETLWLFMLACLLAIICATPWPAAGAFGFYHVQEDEAYVRAFTSLRDGTLTVLSKDTIQGIVQFPSLHMAWAIVYTYAARGVRFLFPILLVLNTLLFLATPSIGGHHFVDLLGGVLLAIATIMIVRKMSAAGLIPEDDVKK